MRRAENGTSGRKVPSFPDGLPTGAELFYATREGIFSVAVGAGPAPTIGTPQLLVPSSGQLSATARPDWYDVAPDGKQFLVFQRDPATPNVQDVPNVIVNWFEELKAVR